MQKSLEFSGNLMLFLPKNTSVKEIVTRLLPYHESLIEDQNNKPINLHKQNELVIEIEQLVFGNSCKALLVCTGSLAKVCPTEVAGSFVK